jgi:hypothetical protein
MSKRYELNDNQVVMIDPNDNMNYLSRDYGIQTMDISGKYIRINNDVGLNINGNSGSIGQVLTKDNSNNMVWTNPTSGWVATATSGLNMGPYSITAPSLDAVNSLILGGNTATSVALGRLNKQTNIIGNVQINGNSGNANQVLTSNGTTTAPTWQSTKWVSTATSALNMGTNGITSCPSLDSTTSLAIGPTTATSVTIGRTNILTTINGSLNVNASLNINGILNINGNSGNANQVLTSNGTSAPTWQNSKWVDVATSALNMGNFSINCSAIDSTNALTLGTTSATSVAIGRTNILTTITGSLNVNASLNINGILNINGNSGTANQVLTSNGTSAPTWQNSKWVDTATSALNMGNFSINCSALDSTNALTIGTTTQTGLTMGRPAISTEIRGLSLKISINNDYGSNVQVLKSGGSGASATWGTYWNPTAVSALSMATFGITNCPSLDSATSLLLGGSSATSVALGRTGIITNINGSFQMNSSAGVSGQVLTSNGTAGSIWATIPSSSWVPTATSALNMGNFSINCSVIDSATSLVLGGTNATSVTLGRRGIITNINGSFQMNSSAGVSGQVLTSNGTAGSIWATIPSSSWVDTATRALNMATYSITNCPSLDSATSLLLGTTNATSVAIGRTGIITNINGSFQMNSSAGVSGQVLTSNGIAGSIWATIPSSSWVPTATSGLNMGTYGITNCPSLDSNTSLTLGGTSATSVTLGKTGIITNINGSFQINSSAGVSGQVLTSNGTAGSIWATIPSSSWVPTATSSLNMATFSINCSVLDSSTSLLLGTTNATSVAISRSGILTTINGSLNVNASLNINGILNINGNSGNANQVLTSNGTSVPTWQNSKWVDTATSALNMATYSINCSVIDSTNALTIGTTNQTSLTMGKSTTATEIKGSSVKIGINNDYGTSGYVLKSGGSGASASWGTYWNPTAISALSMGTFGITNCTSLDSATSLVIGGTNQTGLTMGKSTTATEIKGSSIKIGINDNYGTTLQVLKSGGSGATATWGTYWNPTAESGLSMENNGITNCASLEPSSELKIGATNKTINITGILKLGGVLGSNGQVLSSNANSVPTWKTIPDSTWVGTANSPLNMLTHGITGTSMDSNTTLSLGTSTATTTTLGKSNNTATNIAGGSIGITGNTTITGTASVTGTLTALTQITNTNNTAVATTAWTNTFFGLKGSANTWTGAQDFTSATLTALTQVTNTNTTEVATTAWTNTFYAPKLSPIFTGNITTNSIIGSATNSDVNAWNNLTTGDFNMLTGNLTGAVNILTGATRSSTTLMLTSATANTFRLGAGTTGLGLTVRGAAASFESATTEIKSPTTTLSGATTNFNSTTNNFLNAIRGTGTTLGISTPIAPSYTYTDYTGSGIAGTGQTGTIGCMIPPTTRTNSNSMVSSGTYVDCGNFTSIPLGVYMLKWYQEILAPSSNSTITSTKYAVGTASLGTDITNQQMGPGNITLGANRTFGGCICIPVTIVTGSTSLYLSASMIFSGGTPSTVRITALETYLVRIA